MTSRGMKKSNPQFPLYIVSKGRWQTRHTARSLEEMKVPYFIVVEPQEYASYCSVIDRRKVLVLDMSYKERYELCDDLGLSKSTGPGPARNFAWDHSVSNGFAWHWVMDDNIDRFYRLHENTKIPIATGAGFKAMEDFVLRYTNIGMAGPNYAMFAKRKFKLPPYITNTRIYSCNLIRNDLPFRWRGRYNEDTILSLDMLKAGWCTVQFYAFLQNKLNTQLVKGGNTAEFYAREGTKPKSEMLVRVHPDVSRLMFRFGRHHHYVDYKPFQATKLRRKSGVVLSGKADDYGLSLVNVNGEKHE